MEQRFDRPINWLNAAGKVVIAAAALATLWVMSDALDEVQAQREERDCRFDLTTETDKIDSDIGVVQAQIFEAAILRPNPGGGATQEMRELGNELHTLIESREIAYTQRRNDEARCDDA